MIRYSVALALLAAFVAGCGAGESSSTSGRDATPAVEWANGLCEAVSTFGHAVASTVNNDPPTEENVRTMRDELRSATKTFSENLKGLGRPDTEMGQEAKDALDALMTTLDARLQKVDDEVDNASGSSGAEAAAATIATALVAMDSDTNTAFQQAGLIDAQGDPAQGELADAVEQASACAEL